MLLPSGLLGEIGLGKRRFPAFWRVAVLGDIVNAALGAFCRYDHFASVNKMVLHFFAG